MSKKTLIGLLGVIILLGGSIYAYNNKPQTQNIKFEELKAYFLKNDIPLQEDSINYFIVENQEDISAIFGIAKTMVNQVETINFNNELVVALAHPTANFEAKLNINYIKFINNNIYIDYTFTKGQERDYHSTPISIIKFTKPQNIYDLYFSSDENIDQKIAFGRRTLGSPMSINDLKDNYTGIYKGILPCADCDSIENTLELNPDMTYELNTIYQNKTKIPVRDSGTWSISDDLVQIRLGSTKNYYFIIDNKTLNKADANGKRIESDLNYTLIKQEN